MQPIFSAINDAHRGLALDPPAVDNHFLSRARRGLGRAQAAVSTRDTRIPLPPEAILSILTAAEASTAGLPALRRASALSLTGLFAGRSDTSVHLRSEDVQLTPDFIWLRLTEKGKRHRSVRRVVRLPLSQRAIDGVMGAVCLLIPAVIFDDLAEGMRRINRQVEAAGWRKVSRVRGSEPMLVFVGTELREKASSQPSSTLPLKILPTFRF